MPTYNKNFGNLETFEQDDWIRSQEITFRIALRHHMNVSKPSQPYLDRICERAERSDFLLPELIFSDVKQFIPRQETILQVVENNNSTGSKTVAEALLSGVVQSRTLDAISLT